MKTINKVLLIILVLIVISQCKKETDPFVTIPDNNFLNALIKLGVDKNGDGIISKVEAYELNFLDVTWSNISNMKGIEAFVNLDSLFCGINPSLTGLDVTNNTALRKLQCNECSLMSLNVLNNINLENLQCAGNKLKSLDLSKNPALNSLYCSYNSLTGFDVSHNPALKKLYCDSNSLTNLNVSKNPELRLLWCGKNSLTNLDLSNNPVINILACSSNSLTTIDVSKNTALKYLFLTSMPSLNKVCVWTMPFPPSDVTVDTTNSPNVYFTTDCSR